MDRVCSKRIGGLSVEKEGVGAEVLRAAGAFATGLWWQNPIDNEEGTVDRAAGEDGAGGRPCMGAGCSKRPCRALRALERPGAQGRHDACGRVPSPGVWAGDQTESSASRGKGLARVTSERVKKDLFHPENGGR